MLISTHFQKTGARPRMAALRHVLGAVPVDAATPLAGGITTAAVFRIDAGAHRYVLRVEGTPSPMRNPYQYQSMRIASDAGIAPRLYYFDEDSRVAVIDYIAPQPLDSFPGGPLARAQALGALLRDLRTTPTFPYYADYPDVVARLWAHVCRTGLFAPGVLDPVNERLAEIRKAYVWDRANSVSCHNDPVPGEHPVRRPAPLADRLGRRLSQRPVGRRVDRDGPFGAQPGTRGSAAAGLARPAAG